MAGYPPAPSPAASSTGWATPSRSWAQLTPQQKAAWPRFRDTYLRTHTRCAIAIPNTCTHTATTVDHLDGCDYRTDFLNPAWCRSVCQPCHRTRTSQQGNAAQLRNTEQAHRRASRSAHEDPRHHSW